MTARPRVLIAGPLDPSAAARLAAMSEPVHAADTSEDALCRLIVDCDALIARTSVPITARVLESGKRLRVVGVPGVGIDNIDQDAARRLGIAVEHTPDASSDAVAELTALLLLMLLRPAPEYMAAYRRGEFAQTRDAARGVELRDLTVGILGMGRIGSRAARIFARGFNARVLYHDVESVGPFDFDCESCATAGALATRVDVLSVHVPLTPQTRGLVDAALLARMLPGARLINTARGAIVATAALVDALGTGQLAGAALDVTDPEPLPPAHALWTMPGVILTPHIGARTPGATTRMMSVVDQVLRRLGES